MIKSMLMLAFLVVSSAAFAEDQGVVTGKVVNFTLFQVEDNGNEQVVHTYAEKVGEAVQAFNLKNEEGLRYTNSQAFIEKCDMQTDEAYKVQTLTLIPGVFQYGLGGTTARGESGSVNFKASYKDLQSISSFKQDDCYIQLPSATQVAYTGNLTPDRPLQVFDIVSNVKKKSFFAKNDIEQKHYKLKVELK